MSTDKELLYSISNIEDFNNASTIILFLDGEDRSEYILKLVLDEKILFNNLIIMYYDQYCISQLQADIGFKNNIHFIQIPGEQLDYINKILSLKEYIDREDLFVDISGLRTIDLFLLLKIFKTSFNIKCLYIANTVPFDYVIDERIFSENKAVDSDLELQEVYGYSGNQDMTQDCYLYILLGFEGNLSNKVAEEVSYKELYIINTMPSYYQKYKDISLINNEKVLPPISTKLLYVPVDNPFFVYNILKDIIKDDKPICIAPLCTKPVSLGVCLYALENNVRVVYPLSNDLNYSKTENIYKSNIYKINI